MASTQQRVRFTGVVRGQGGEAECAGWVTMVTLPGLPPEYTQYHIDTLSKPLPDGNYTVFAHGGSYAVRYVNGHWLASL
jgi:hypothetical protein